MRGRRRRDRRAVWVLTALVVLAAAAAASAWTLRGDTGAPEADTEGPVLAELRAAGPLTLAHFSGGTLYADGRAIPYDGPEGQVVDAGPDVLLRTPDGRVVRIDKAGRVTEIGSNAAAAPVVDAAARYVAWPVSPDSRYPTHTGVTVWDLEAERAVGQPAFPFPPGADGPAPVALDRSARAYLAAPDGRLWAWDRVNNLQVVSGVSDVDAVAGGGAGLVIHSGETSTNFPKPEPDELVDGQPVSGAQAAWSRTGAVAWFDGSDLRVAAEDSDDGVKVGWPTDAEPGRIAWESDNAFVVLPESSKQPAIRCYVGNDDCRVVAKSAG